jgi:hypothetical protein
LYQPRKPRADKPDPDLFGHICQFRIKDGNATVMERRAKINRQSKGGNATVMERAGAKISRQNKDGNATVMERAGAKISRQNKRWKRDSYGACRAKVSRQNKGGNATVMERAYRVPWKKCDGRVRAPSKKA